MTIKERNSYRISAAGGAQRTSSSYNHSILKELILYYKNKLEQEKDIYSKDCDHKERLALIKIWPNIARLGK
ncbi:hypothetical protein RclHR1_01490010 [Rhizophagus clarus]|uniref:Uncharacterized protein n=1 Tax=Rhizophagus clarus TaxID=94130 RepID=A0A2Z6QR85_9GLOM|nr:hypothetical protein RclHR1_01490010 [Rhizophagus clarus]